MKKIISFLFAAIFLGILILSCHKEDVKPNTIFKNGLSIRYFEDLQELQYELDNIANMDFDELVEYESNLNFNSYGKTAYLLVEELTGDTTILSEEMLAQIEQYYPQYFIITTECDENADIIVDIRYDNTPFTFIMNEDRMFQVGDSVYKVFDDCLVITDIANIEDLSSLDEDGLPEIEGNEDYLVLYYQEEEAKTNHGRYLYEEGVNGKEKVKSWLVLTQLERHSVNGCVIASYSLDLKIKGFRKFCGIFWPVKRTLSDNIYCGISINNVTYYNSDQGSSSGYVRNVPIMWGLNMEAPLYYQPQYYITYAVGYARTPAAIAVYNYQ
ncbi:MAG: hypothetical protein IKQ20_09060 [Bacteroidales bacterium]|nr:hypothetical protein [Bacteroidales bacterium]